MPIYKTPGVYINEIDAFGNSVVPVATTVPVFIGYTPQASYEGKSYLNVPQKITSKAYFEKDIRRLIFVSLKRFVANDTVKK